ncbi:hypothetical protein [Adlercreutzia agrestimuris]|uniref:hypothetical protein n=1 Tax=Adlercreutzia agrestimuris TaxID=2941324 RepID=UPI00203CC4B0|nr:hypothetical protein [Adlercreutzia agrestimuris]
MKNWFKKCPCRGNSLDFGAQNTDEGTFPAKTCKFLDAFWRLRNELQHNAWSRGWARLRAGGQVQRGQAVCSRNSSYMLQNLQHYISMVSIAELGKLSE